MKTPTLAPVYVDNEPISLMGDPRPTAGKVLAATLGMDSEGYILHQDGKALDREHTIDRTVEPTKPLHFTSTKA